MSHAGDMTARLPALYREGELVEALCAVPGLELEIVDEDALAVQRSHGFDTAFTLEEAARLAAVLDIAPEPWQSLAEFRGWVHALRDSRLKLGAVTPGAVKSFFEAYIAAFQRASGARLVGRLDTWADAPARDRPALIENPPRMRVARVPETGVGIEPLQRFHLKNSGLDAAPLALSLIGLPGGREYMPLLANLTSGDALLFKGSIAPGERLWIRPSADGSATAELAGRDVTSRLFGIAGITPGKPLSKADLTQPARALTLVRQGSSAQGDNELWFLPVAFFDEEGLDRVLLSLPDTSYGQGRFDGASFDHAIFAQDPRVKLHAVWTESEPATFRVDLPAGTLLSDPDRRAEALEARTRLKGALVKALDRLRPVGVRASVRMTPLSDVQRLGDRMTLGPTLVHREMGPTGADRLRDPGGAFELTNFDGSTFR